MVLRSVSYFRERDQGHDHVTHGDRSRGRCQVGQAHVGVNGIVKDEGRGEIICGFQWLMQRYSKNLFIYTKNTGSGTTLFGN